MLNQGQINWVDNYRCSLVYLAIQISIIWFDMGQCMVGNLKVSAKWNKWAKNILGPRSNFIYKYEVLIDQLAHERS